jgi:hypothetical protein
MKLWVGCLAGALQEDEFATRLRSIGFEHVEIELWRLYEREDARAFLTGSGLDVEAIAPLVEGRFASAFVRARKPVAKACCATGCCS